MEYREYQHIVKLDDPEVEGLLVGKCYVFPKIDGTNSTLWLNSVGELHAGSRRREIRDPENNDNQGFYTSILTEIYQNREQSKWIKFFDRHPLVRLYGEWLVPHTLKTYRDDAWRKFYVFDVCSLEDGGNEEFYVPYPVYKEWFDEFGIDYIPPLGIVTDPTYDDLVHILKRNTYLIKEGYGIGEGIVIKNYQFVNKYGRITWAKIVTNEFKDQFHKDMGAPEKENCNIEKEVVDKLLTKEIVDKVYVNILYDNISQVFKPEWIPRLLNTVYYEFVREEIWSALKMMDKMKMRSIDFKNLKQHSFNKVKEFYPQLFRRTINE